MHTKTLKKSLSPVVNFGYKNLLVSGCSFTENKNSQHIISWPYFLRDLGSFDQVIDCSCAGAGNTHIHNSIIYELETNRNITAENTLVVVMWSGYDRDDFIVSPDVVKHPYPDSYFYDNDCYVGMTGGITGESNLIVSVDAVKKIKSDHSRAVENYILVSGLYHYLKSKNFNFVFTEFVTPKTVLYPEYDIVDYLDSGLANKFITMTRQMAPTLGCWSIPFLHLSSDGFHPAGKVHLSWTKQILIPYLQKTLNVKHN